jgi:hypothetical protein
MIAIHRRRACLCGLALLLAACGGGGGGQAVPLNDPVPRQGALRFVNAVVDASPLTASLSGSTAGTVAYGQATGLQSVLVGDYTLAMLGPAVDGGLRVAVPVQQQRLTQDDEITVIATGTVAAPQALLLRNVEFLFGITDLNFSKEPEIQFIHVAGSRGALDYYLTDAAADLAAATPDATLSGMQFTAVRDVPASQNYRLRVTVAGDRGQVVFDSGTFALSRTTRTHFLTLDHFGPGSGGIVVNPVVAGGSIGFPTPQLPSSLRLFNLLGGGPAALDLHIGEPDDTPFIAGVGRDQASSYVSVPVGTTSVTITAAGSTDVLRRADLQAAAGFFYTLHVIGDFTRDDLTLPFVADDFRPLADNAVVQVVGASASAGALSAFLLQPGQLPGSATPLFSVVLGTVATTALAPGAYDLILRQAGVASTVFGPVRLVLEAGERTRLLIRDQPDGGPPVEVQVAPLPATPAP